MLNAAWIREAFTAFTTELAERIGPHRATLRLNRYFLFFAKLEANFDSPSALTPARIASVFGGAEGLRRYAVPYGFLITYGPVPKPSDAALVAEYELRRQHQVLNAATDQWYADLLTRFHGHLLAIAKRYESRGWVRERQRYLPRTVTQNLRSAAQFLKDLTGWEVQMPQQITQLHLDRFLGLHPGYRDAIRSFVRYLNRREKLFRPLKILTVSRNLPPGLFLDPPRYRELLRTWLDPKDRELKRSLVCLMLLLYAQPIKRVVRLKLSDVLRDHGGVYRIRFDKVEIQMHDAVGQLLSRYLASRSALATLEDEWANAYLFTGRGAGRHLTEAAVTYYLRTYGVSAPALFSTALYQAYLHGIRHPKVLVRAFGIAPATAIRYLNLIDPRLRAEMEARASG